MNLTCLKCHCVLCRYIKCQNNSQKVPATSSIPQEKKEYIKYNNERKSFKSSQKYFSIGNNKITVIVIYGLNI